MNISSSMAVVGSMALTAAAVTMAASAGASPATQFGQLSWGSGNIIPFNVGNQLGNDGFTFSNHAFGASTVTIGLKAIPWQGTNFDPSAYTVSSNPNGGAWLNRDAAGNYIAAPGLATQTRDGSGNVIPYNGSPRARWAFNWSATLDGAKPTTAGQLYLRMIVDGTSTSAPLSMDLGDLSSNFANASDPAYQNSWNVAFNFLSGQGSVNDEGIWNIKIQVFSDSGYTSAVGEQAINVGVVPAPGAIALLGLAGLSVRRRRN
jgi:MYXO-CTERM domain-containing protein